jgi:hypothetical protein
MEGEEYIYIFLNGSTTKISIPNAIHLKDVLCEAIELAKQEKEVAGVPLLNGSHK